MEDYFDREDHSDLEDEFEDLKEQSEYMCLDCPGCYRGCVDCLEISN